MSTPYSDQELKEIGERIADEYAIDFRLTLRQIAERLKVPVDLVLDAVAIGHVPSKRKQGDSK